MSATNRGSERREDDYYPTTPDLAEHLVRRLCEDFFPTDPPVNVLDPGCGEGIFLDACRTAFPVTTFLDGEELDPERAQEAREKGYTVETVDTLTHDERAHYHLIVGNPPFRLADEFIRTLYEHLDPAHGVLAFLLRLNYLGGQQRYEDLWQEIQPARVYVLPARPGFIRTGPKSGNTDATEYMLAVFHPRHDDRPEFEWLDNRDVRSSWPSRPEKTDPLDAYAEVAP